MKTIIASAAEHVWSSLLGLLVVTGVATTQLHRLHIDISAEGMIVKDDPVKALYEHSREVFPGEDSLVLFFRDTDLLSEAKLEAIHQSLAAVDALPFVRRTESLFSISNVKSQDGEITSSPFLERLPTTQEEADHIRSDALFNPLIERNLLSLDGTAMAVRLIFTDDAKGPEFDARVVNAIERALEPVNGVLEEAFQMGGPYIRQSIAAKIQVDQRRILPSSIVVLMLTLAMTLRRANAAIVPLLTAGISIIWTLAFMAILDIPVSVLTSLVPALLIIIGSTEDVHLLAEYYAGIRMGLQKTEALNRMSRHMGTAILLTCLTTYVGFLTIATNNITLIQQFGLVASTGIIFNFLITALLVPAWLRLVDSGKAARRSEGRPVAFQRAAEWIFEQVQKNQRATILLVVGLVVIFAYGAVHLRVNNDPMAYFNEGEPIVHRVNAIEENLSGVERFSVIMRSDIEGTFLKARYLAELKKLQDYLDGTSLFDKTLSFADYIALINAIIVEDKSGKRYLPASDDILQEYMLFVKHKDIADYVSDDYSEARIIVRHGIGSSYELTQALEAIEHFAKENVDRGLEVYVTGESILRTRAADTIAVGQAKSLLLMALAIWLIISVLFADARIGLIALIPHVIPIVALFGVMGYVGVPLDTATGIIAAIALGICVDDAMHFLVRYHYYTRKHLDEAQALRETVQEEATPIIATSLGLALGFAVLALSSFPPVTQFGLLSAMVMVLALLAVFVVLPLLLSSLRLITLYDLLTLHLREAVLERCDLFRGMRASQIKKLVLVSQVRELEAGEAIVSQGETGDEMFVVLDGEVEVSKTLEDGHEKKLRIIPTGELFGEIALVTRSARTATVTARTPTKILVLKWDGIRRIARFHPRISSKLFQNLASVISRRLADSTPINPLSTEKSSGP